MRTFFVTALLGTYALAVDLPTIELDFMKYIAKHNKSYDTREEYQFRLERFIETDKFVQEVNEPNSEYTHTAAHNKFSDWTRDEYKRMLGQLGKPDFSVQQEEAPLHHELYEVNDVLPTSAAQVDWRDSNCQTAVKDQGQCGSCWAFGATETVESSYCIGGGTLYTLAPQQMVDCSTANYGCNGGWQQYAWEYLETSGQELETEYPYTAKDGHCKYDSSLGKVSVMTTSPGPYTNVSPVVGNATSAQMMSATEVKPQSVSIEADSFVFQTYSSGVLTSANCGTSTDHAVVVSGYDNTASTPYWIVRNSWGTSWGQAGYLYIGMSTGKGICGINTDMRYPYTVAWTG